MIINLMAEDGGDNAEITARTTAFRSRVRSALLAALQRAADRGEAAAMPSNCAPISSSAKSLD
jgi:hypothetical protein